MYYLPLSILLNQLTQYVYLVHLKMSKKAKKFFYWLSWLTSIDCLIKYSRSIDIVKEYCSVLRNDVDIETEKLIQAVQNYREAYLKKIADYEKECIGNIETNRSQNDDLDRFIEEMKSFCVQW